MNIKDLIRSIKHGVVLLPKVVSFLEREYADLKIGKITSDEITRRDAKLSLALFKRRLEGFRPDKRWHTYYHPSSLGKCIRLAFYKRFRAEEDPSRDANMALPMYITFELGTYLHVIIQNLLQRAGFLVEREIPVVSDKFKLAGHADGIVEVDGVKHLLEIKSINSRSFTMLKELPQDSHQIQVLCYMQMLKLENTIFWYVNKDRSQIKEISYAYNSQLFRLRVSDRLAELEKACKSFVVPEREGLSPAEEPCRYCPYTLVCFDPKTRRVFLKQHSLKDAED